MTDIETNATTVGIAAALIALKEIGMGIWKAIRKGNADRKQARAEAKVENAERDQWKKINEVSDALNQHRLDDASAFATLNANQSTIIKAVERIESKVDVLHRRSTDQIKRDR